MLGNNIKLEMPVFLFENGHAGGKSGRICIRGMFDYSGEKVEFQGFIELDGEVYDIKSIDLKNVDGQGSVLILAGYNKEGMELSRGAAAYLDSDLKYIKGTLYRFDGTDMSPVEFAAPAKTLEDAAEISRKLIPGGMAAESIKGKDNRLEYI